MSRTRRSAWNLAAGMIYALAAAGATLIATPLLLRWLGSETLGAYKALTDWIGYLAFLEAGLGGAMMASLAMRLGQDDREAVVNMLASGLRSYRWLMLLQLAGGLALVVALPSLISRSMPSDGELRTAGAVAILPFFLAPLLVYRALAEARQRGYVNWLVMTIQVLMMYGLLLATARLGWGLPGQSAAFAAAQLPALLLLAWDGSRAYRGAWRTAPDPSDRKALLKLSWPTFIHGMTDRIGLVSDNILIAWIMGPAAVVPFFLTQQLALMAQSQLRGVGSATWAGLAELHARGDNDNLRMRLVELTGIVSGLGMAVLMPIAAYNRYFVQLWVGGDAYAGDAVTLLTCFNALLWAVFALWGWVILGTGQIRRWMPFAVISTLVNVAVSVIGTAALGVVGPLLGTATGLLLVASWALPLTLHRIFKINSRALWLAALAPARWSLPYAAGLWAVSKYFPPVGWLGFISATSLATSGGLALWWRLGLGKEERLEWKARLKRSRPLCPWH
jgi:O-antigen/teichoic acid export membrane protein